MGSSRRGDSNPGPLGEKRKHYLCAPINHDSQIVIALDLLQNWGYVTCQYTIIDWIVAPEAS